MNVCHISASGKILTHEQFLKKKINIDCSASPEVIENIMRIFNPKYDAMRVYRTRLRSIEQQKEILVKQLNILDNQATEEVVHMIANKNE